jgi:aromatic ring-opening dioxygenase LigB subunit
MPVKTICVVPHGGILINGRANTKKTIKGFECVAKKLSKKNISHLFIVDPHDIIHRQKFMCFLSSVYSEEKPESRNKIDRIYMGSAALNLALLSIKSNYISHKVEINHNIKWGSSVPLYFLSGKNRSITVASIDRKIPTNDIRKAGCEIFELLNNRQENIAIVLSCDLSHSHSTENLDFPYHCNSKIYDDHVYNTVNMQKIENYNDIPDIIIETARTDAHAQLTMLAGICTKYSYCSKVFSYEIPSYYGMLTGIIELE